MKDFFVATIQVVTFLAIVWGIILGIFYLSSIGKEDLQYITKTPYKTYIKNVAKFDKGECQQFYDNLTDKTGYRCIPTWKAFKEEILGEAK